MKSKLDLMTDRFNGMCASYKSAIEKIAELEAEINKYHGIANQFKRDATWFKAENERLNKYVVSGYEEMFQEMKSKIASLTAEVQRKRVKIFEYANELYDLRKKLEQYEP